MRRFTFFFLSFLLLVPIFTAPAYSAPEKKLKATSESPASSALSFFSVPKPWMRIRDLEDGSAAFRAGAPSLEAAVVMVRAIGSAQVPMEWARDEADYVRKKGVEISVGPIERKYGSHLFAQMRSNVQAAGKKGVVEQYFVIWKPGVLLEVALSGSAAFVDRQRTPLNDFLASFNAPAPEPLHIQIRNAERSDLTGQWDMVSIQAKDPG